MEQERGSSTNTTKGLAIVTGATHGIGKQIARVFLKNGFNLAMCARSKKELSELQEKWQQQFPKQQIIALPTDVGKRKDIIQFAKAIRDSKLPISALVNNAGIFIPGKIADEPEGLLEEMMAVNVYSAYHLTRALLPQMVAHGEGHIFNICSVASLKEYPSGGSYGITKHALLGFSDNLREELKEQHIKVTAIAPGATYSRSWAKSGIDKARVMKAKDVADMVWATYSLGGNAVVERIIIRPLLGDL